MRKIIFPLLLVTSIAVAAHAFFSEEPPSKEMTIALPATAELSPFLMAAAKDLGHKRVRAYDGGVFINDGDETIAFYKTKTGMEMHVAFETEYRRRHGERQAALNALKVKGQSIYEHAKSLQARSAAEGVFAKAGTKLPTDG